MQSSLTPMHMLSIWSCLTPVHPSSTQSCLVPISLYLHTSTSGKNIQSSMNYSITLQTQYTTSNFMCSSWHPQILIWSLTMATICHPEFYKGLFTQGLEFAKTIPTLWGGPNRVITWLKSCIDSFFLWFIR